VLHFELLACNFFWGETSLADNQIRISREELYEKVWTSPLRKLAPEFGLSDVGLAKLCKRHAIPLPGLGYWTRVQFGKGPKRIPLPPLEKSIKNQLEIVIQPTPANRIIKDLNSESKADTIRIQLSDNEPLSHPFAIRTQKLLSHATKNERGLLVPKNGFVSHISVSDSALPRALRILSGLLRVLEERNFTVTWAKDEGSKLCLVALDEEMHFVIFEKIEAVPHTLTEREAARQKRGEWIYPPKWDYRSTGNLRVSIEGSPQGIRHSWSDGKEQRLENCLGKFISALPIIAEARKREREEHRRRQQEWEEEAKRREEHRARQEEYQRRAEVLNRLAAKWRDAQFIRDFALAFAKASSQLCRTHAGKREAEALFVAAMEYADSVDPLNCVSTVITEFKNTRRRHTF
jgi:hypothetical protein